MFWMFLINTIGITLMWVAFWFLLIITQKGGKTSDKNQSFQLWFFLFVLQAGRSGQPNDCSFLKLGNPGKRIIVRSGCPAQSAVAPGQTGRFLRLFAPRCCPAAWKLLHAHPACPVSEQLFGIQPGRTSAPGHLQQLARPAFPVKELLFGIGLGSVSGIGLWSRIRSSSVLHGLLHQSSFFANIGRKAANFK